MPHAPCPMPDAPCPMPHAPCPMLIFSFLVGTLTYKPLTISAGIPFMFKKYQLCQWFLCTSKMVLFSSSAFLLLMTSTFTELPGSKLLAQENVVTQDLEAASYYQQGVTRYNRNDLLSAEYAFRQALQRDPNLGLARNYLGNIFLQQNRLSAAVQEYAEAIRMNPNLGEAYYNLALALQKQGQKEAAITAYRQALVIDPTMVATHYNLGLALYEQGQLKEAIAEYQQAINFDSTNANAYFNLAIALQQQGEIPQAIAAYRQAVQLNPKNASAYSNLGSLLASLGQASEAVNAYKQALSQNPKNALAYYNLGVTFYNQGDINKANAAFKRARNEYRELGNLPEANKVEQIMLQIAQKKSQPEVTQTSIPSETPTSTNNQEKPNQPETSSTETQNNPGDVPISVEQQPTLQPEMPNLPQTPLETPANLGGKG
jgi:tetratricopeptide (TPR) repeat protein